MEAESGKCYAASGRETTVMRRARVADYLELCKPRLSLMSVITALFGYFAAPAAKDFTTLISLFIGTALAAGGAAVINQWMEREEDARMPRTLDRPLVTGTIAPSEALFFGLTLSVIGLVVMFLGTNLLATVLIGFTLLLYLLLYTPLKKVSPLNTHVGAIPGALPPLIGWVAAEGQFGLLGWVLFGVLFAWQIPHFMAISWMYRDDYIQGGFEMLSKREQSGVRVAIQSLLFSIVLAVISALPVTAAGANALYWVPAIFLNGAMIALSIAFLRASDRTRPARRLFFATLIYLPLYLSALVAGLKF